MIYLFAPVGGKNKALDFILYFDIIYISKEEIDMIVLDTPEKIELYRLLVLRSALQMEISTGMKMTRGRTAYSMAKKEFGFKGNKKKVLSQLEEYINSKWDKLRAFAPVGGKKMECPLGFEPRPEES